MHDFQHAMAEATADQNRIHEAEVLKQVKNAGGESQPTSSMVPTVNNRWNCSQYTAS